MPLLLQPRKQTKQDHIQPAKMTYFQAHRNQNTKIQLNDQPRPQFVPNRPLPQQPQPYPESMNDERSVLPGPIASIFAL